MFKYEVSDYKTKFEELDANKIINELKIEIKAKKEAELNLPLENAKDLDVNEFEIKNYFIKKIKESNDLVINKKTVFTNILFRVTKALNLSKEVQNLPTKYRNEFEHYINQAKDDFNSRIEKYNSLKKDLSNFKINNKIEREESSSQNKLLWKSLLVLFVILESIMNANFFAKGNELGLVGGFTQAIVVSLINLIIAFFTLYFFRLKNSILISNKLRNIYIFITVSLSIFILIFHLLVGHFRDAFNIDPENAYSIAVKNFIDNPFVLNGFESWLLVIIGILLFVIFLYETSKLYDKYPGYTDIVTRFTIARNEFEDIKHKILDEIKNDEENAQNELKKMITEITNIFNESRDIPNFKKSLKEKYNEQVNYINSLYNLVIMRYRNINEANREKPKPEYFERNETLDGFTMIDFELDFDVEKVNELEEIVINLPKIQEQINTKLIKITKEIKEKSEYIDG